MAEKFVDVTLHIDEETNHGQREALRDAMLAKNGVVAADIHDDRPHLMIVEFDPDIIKSADLLAVAAEKSMHAELLSL